MAENELKRDISADEWAAAMTERQATTRSSGAAAGSGGIFPELTSDASSVLPPGRLDMVLDIPVQLTVELGRTRIPIRNLLQLAQGSVVELDRLAGEPLDVLVNGCLVAQGEVVVVNDKFGIRLTDVIAPDERLRRVNR
jgi:flagellar motor switch protein FliN/FliY